jgi:magnesium-transporting ATPase (P-type)
MPSPKLEKYDYQIEKSSMSGNKFTHLLTSIKKKPKYKIFGVVDWHQLEVGDIVFLKKNELSPCLLLILDSSDPRILVTCDSIEGITNQLEKHPIKGTQIPNNSKHLSNPLDQKKILTGTINFDFETMEKKLGFIRLKKDPAGEDICMENIIEREQILNGCQYVYGLVLMTGEENKFLSRVKKVQDMNKRRSFFGLKGDIMFFMNALILMILTVVHMRIYK